MAIASQGIGAGLDIASLVSQLVAAEGTPKLNQLDRREASFQAEISAFGTLKGALSSFQGNLSQLKDLSSFQQRQASSSDSEIFTATASSTADIGQYGIEVVQLAQAQKLISDGFSTASDVVGTGTLKLSQGTSSFSITIDSSNETLSGIRDAINNSVANTGIRAAIINVDDGVGGTESKLVLTADETGLDNAITVEVDEDGNSVLTDAVDEDTTGLSQLVFKTGVTNLTETTAALDGQIKVDNQLISSSSNKFSDVINGVTISAVGIGAGETLTITNDTAHISDALNSFIDSYNSLVTIIDSLSAFDTETNTAATLVGDSTLRAIEFAVRQQLSATVPGLSNAANSLVAIGVTTNESGQLTLDQSKLNSALEDNLDELAQFFASDDGLANNLDSLISNYIDSEGIITARTDGLKDRVDDITDQRLALDRRLIKIEARLLKQFTAMDELVASLNNTSNFLTQQLANLPGTLNPNKDE